MKTVIFFNKEDDSHVNLGLTASDYNALIGRLENEDLMVRVSDGVDDEIVPAGVMWIVDHEDYMDDVITILLAAVEQTPIAYSELANLPRTFRYLGIYHR